MQNDMSTEPRLAVLHEWVDAYAGSEQVFEALAQAFPSADLLALTWEPGMSLDVGGRRVKTSLLDHRFLRSHRALTLPLMPLVWRAMGSSQYDVVVSSHHAFAHTNRLAGAGLHLSYVHSPARYLWSPEIDRRGAPWYLRPTATALRRIDIAASKRVTDYAANSSEVARRIARFWNRDARVIFPPVRVDYFQRTDASPPSKDFVLGVGRWIPYKNLPVVVEAANLANMPVKIAGRGPDRARIEAAASAAKVPVEIIESPSDEHLRSLYRNAACLVFPTMEDFGIVPVEAQAAGTPVVALRCGGALDTVIDGHTGFLADTIEPAELARLIRLAPALDSEDCTQNANRFSQDRFRMAIRSWVQDWLA